MLVTSLPEGRAQAGIGFDEAGAAGRVGGIELLAAGARAVALAAGLAAALATLGGCGRRVGIESAGGVEVIRVLRAAVLFIVVVVVVVVARGLGLLRLLRYMLVS